jgi:hypothetical protein
MFFLGTVLKIKSYTAHIKGRNIGYCICIVGMGDEKIESSGQKCKCLSFSVRIIIQINYKPEAG